MGKVVGSKQDIYKKIYHDTKSEIKNIVVAQRNTIDAVLTDFYNRQETNAEWGRWMFPLLVPFTVLRGVFQSLNDTELGIKAAFYNFMNNASHVFDESDGYDWKTDLKYLAVDTFATIGEGLASTAVGIGADLVTLFDVNIDGVVKSFLSDEFQNHMGMDEGENNNVFKNIREWAYGAKGEGGTVGDINNYFNSLRAGVLRGDLLSNKSEGQLGGSSDLNQIAIITGQKASAPALDKKLVEGRWVTDESQLTSNTYDNDFGSDEQRYKYYQKVLEAVGDNFERNQNVDKVTLKPQYDAAFGDEKWYKFEDDLFTNLGRMIPVLGLAYLSGGMSAGGYTTGATIASALSTGFFGSMVYGQSFEQAVENGASINDAYTFAMGNMLLEMGTEQIGGFKLGEIPFASAKNMIGIGLEEGLEEFVAELGQTSLSYYGNKDNKMPAAEETPASLRARTAYSAIMGAISGVIMGEANERFMNQSPTSKINKSQQDLVSLLKEGEQRFGLEKTSQEASKNVKKTAEYINSSKVSETEKIDIVQNSIYKKLFNRSQITVDNGDGTTGKSYNYSLNELGQRIANGDISAVQGTQKISKDTHAVGQTQVLEDFDIVAPNGQNIKILTNEEVVQKNNKSLNDFIAWAKSNNMPIAFVSVAGEKNEGSPDLNAYTNFDTGVFYIDVNGNAVENFVAHEIHDKMRNLFQKGMVTSSSFKAYTKFIDLVKSEDFLKLLPDGYLDKRLKEYQKLAKDNKYTQEQTDEMLSRELVSNIIQDVLNNGEILKKVFNKDQTVFRRVAQIFSKPQSYYGIITESKFQDFPQAKRILKKIQKAFESALKENKSLIIKTKDFVNKKVLDILFEQDIRTTTEFKEAFSVKIPEFLGDKQKIVESIFDGKTDKKVVFHRTYFDIRHMLNAVFKTDFGEPFASFFVSDVNNIESKSVDFGNVIIIPKKELFEARSQKHFVFLPVETHSIRRHVHNNENQVNLHSSWTGFNPYFDITDTRIDYAKYMKGLKSEIDKVRTMQMAIVYQSIISQDLIDLQRELEPDLMSIFMDNFAFTNMINTFRDPQNITLNELKNYKTPHSQMTFAQEQDAHIVVYEKMQKFFKNEFLFPRLDTIKEIYSFKDFSIDFYGQKLFWKFAAKIADGMSLEGDLFLKHLNTWYYKNSSYTEESIIEDMRSFVSALYSLGGGSYYEIKSDFNIDDIYKIILVNPETMNFYEEAKQIFAKHNIPYVELRGVEGNKNQGNESVIQEQHEILVKAIEKNALSINFDKTELSKDDDSISPEEKVESEQTLTPQANFDFVVQEPQVVKKYSDLELYVKETSNEDFDILTAMNTKGYKEIIKESNLLTKEFGKKYGLTTVFSSLIETPDRIAYRENYINEEMAKAEKSVKKGYKFVIVTGLPGSGKSSSLAVHLEKFLKAYVADSDIIKEKLPDYNGKMAPVFHQESKQMNLVLLEALEKEGFNIVLPIVGGVESQVRQYAENAKKHGYSIELYYNETDRITAAKRTILRTINEGRFVPLQLVFETEKNPGEVFENLKGDELFDGYYKQHNNGIKYGEIPTVLENFGTDKFATYINRVFKKVAKNNASNSQQSANVSGSVGTNTGTANVGTGQSGNQQQINRFQQAQDVFKTVDSINYWTLENTFKIVIDDILSNIHKSKKAFAKRLGEWYGTWERYIKQIGRGRKLYNHIGSVTSKTLLKEFYDLFQLVSKDKTRVDKNPTMQELEYIVKKVNEAIFSAFHYNDSTIKGPVNITTNNPEGLLHTRGMDWFFRDVVNQKVWDTQSTSKFNNDSRGRAYRRLINSILHFNEKGGAKEVEQALKYFVLKTDVEPIVDMALDDGDVITHTAPTVKDQWQQNTQNIKDVSRIIDYGTRINDLIDGFTVSEILGMYNQNSWSQVLMNRIVRGVNRQLAVTRVFKTFFDQGGWFEKNYHNIAHIDKSASEVEIQGLGGIKVRLSQVMYLRNVLAREIVRNRAIERGLVDKTKTHHFDVNYIVRILHITDVKADKFDKRIDGTMVDPVALLNEVDAIIEGDNFLKEYNNKVLTLFTMLHPYIQERYMEINGLVLSNDGQEIHDVLKDLDQIKIDEFFDDLPDSLNFDSIVNLYVPFLLDNSNYFKRNKVDFKEILDYGVFDGMTQELSDNNASLNIESITTVLNTYAQEVANYYGLHRVMSDLNIVMNEQLDTEGQTTYVNGNISHQAVNFYKDLLLDTAGYKIGKRSSAVQKTLKFVRKNFYRAALAANIKVIFTQFATAFNLANIYGDTLVSFMRRFTKNFYSQLSKENKIKIAKMTDLSNIYWDRSYNSTFEIGQASTEGVITGENSFNRFMEKLMGGIIATDNAINKAFYLSLLETVNPNTGKNYTEEEAVKVLDIGILRSQSSALDITKAGLLRTDSDIVKIFMKFMGEPMKHVTQLYSSAKQLELIKKMKQGQSAIAQHEEKLVKAEKDKLDVAYDKFKKAEVMEQSVAFATMTYKEQQAIHKAVKKFEAELKEQQARLDKVTQNADDVNKQVQATIDSEPMAKELAGRRVTAFITSLLYLTILGIGFGLIRSGGGKTDKEKDETFLAYLGRKTGVAFADEVFGMFPFVRDVYQLVGHGFSLDSIDELTAFNDLGTSLFYMLKALNGDNVNWQKTIHSVLISGGKVMGIPTSSLERIFTTSLLYTSPTTYYKYKALIGGKNTDNIQLANAIKKGDDRMIAVIVDHKIQERNIQVSETVLTELNRLVKSGFEVSMSGVNDSFTQDGIEYVLSNEQKEKFAQIYNQADLIITKIISTGQYRRLNDDMKQSLIQAVYNYYYRLAKQTVLEEMSPDEEFDLVPKDKVFRSLSQAFTYFRERADAFYKTQNSNEYRKKQIEAKRKATT